MTKQDWKRLAVLSKEHANDYFKERTMSEKNKKEYGRLLDKTREVAEHPEDWDWGCLCQLCCSYGD